MKNSEYKTKQRQIILEYIKQNKDRQLTVNDILESLYQKQEKPSIATVYRYLDKLVNEGKLKKEYSEEKNASTFQYVNKMCNNHYHLKCEKCGKLIHLDTEALSELENVIDKNYNFELDNVKTILYGVCSNCK